MLFSLWLDVHSVGFELVRCGIAEPQDGRRLGPELDSWATIRKTSLGFCMCEK